MSAELSPEQLVSMARDIMATKMFSLASCVMLFYDIMLTFGEEVERVWLKKFSHFTVLWFLNRYLSPLGYIVIIVSFNDSWSQDVCNRYVLYPEALKCVTAFIIGVIFIIRLYAIYSRSFLVLFLGVCLLAAEIAVKIWAFTDGTSLIMPPGFVGCILIGRHYSRFVFTWVAELVFDSVVVYLTFWRTAMHNRELSGNATSLYNLILRDGLVYFGVIFVANLATVLIFLLAPPNLKAMSASFSTLITSLMVSRLILNLRDAGTRDDNMTYTLGRVTTQRFSVGKASGSDSQLDVQRMLFALRTDMSHIKSDH